MQVTEIQSDGLKRQFKVVVSAKDIGEKVDARLAQLGQQVRIPGFRPGKVPIKVLKKRFGQSVMGEVLETAVNDSSNQALDERGLRPAMQPKIEITSFEEGKDLEYTIDLEVMPEIKPADFSKIELERLKVEVPDDEVNAALERIASSQEKSEALESSRPAKSGDVLVIDFKGTVDGESFPGMEAEDHHLKLGSNAFVAGFEDQLDGAEVGEERSVTITFPKEYVNDKLAGRDAVFQVKVKEIRQPVPVKVDDEMAAGLGAENLEQLKTRVREQLGGEYESLTRAKLKRDLLDKLAEAHDFTVPPGMVDLEFTAIWKQIDADRKEGRHDPEDEGKSEDELKIDYRQIAERRVRLGLLLSEVGRSNGIEVTQEELNRALLQEVQRYPGQERQALEYFQKNAEALANLRAPLFEDKVIDYILDLAKVSERSVTPEKLREEAEAAGAAADDEASQPSKG